MSPSPRKSAVLTKLEAHYPQLSGQQRRAADYLLAHPRTVFAMSVQELARAADVSEATLVRFARSLGFEGYLELRGALTDEVKREVLPEDRFAREAPTTGPMATVAKVARREIENVERTLAALDPKQLARFVALLREAPSIATVGLGVSSLLARLAAYSLFQAGLRAEALGRDALTLVEQVDRLPRGTVVFAFGLAPYSKDTVAAVAHARGRRLPVLVVTDGVGSPLVPHATARLFTHSENIFFTNAVGSAAVLVNALATELALTNKGKALGALQRSNRALADEYVGGGSERVKR